ncbi:SLC24A4 [Lepeophtheirus salmonis]|uniref:SLC24A4 n=1 Tax=Lepeophtheirus salmonis TaxID=72036 RepID=A0A7R8CMH4_LEPSM|nr:SLC24A4 [Lepeophtheirus salmonis]CAF2866720.1 SLC24A4 [Lepeophtheirus salmonis]
MDPFIRKDAHLNRDLGKETMEMGSDGTTTEVPLTPSDSGNKTWEEAIEDPLQKPDPRNKLALAKWAFLYPLNFISVKTIPDCRQEKFAKYYVVSFFIAISWISLYSYVMVWMITIIGFTFGVPDTVMGLTFIAAGVSVPDALSGIAVVKEGHGDMAVSNAIGSNVFDILVCLGIPWFIKTAIISPGTYITIKSKGLVYSTLERAAIQFLMFLFRRFNYDAGIDNRLYKIIVIGEVNSGVDFHLKVLQFKKDLEVRLQLWDIAGQERFSKMTRAYFKGSVGAIKWKEELDEKCALPEGQNVPAILLSNKSDMPKHPNLPSDEEISKFVETNGFVPKWFKTSAKTGENIQECINFLIKVILKVDSWSTPYYTSPFGGCHSNYRDITPEVEDNREIKEEDQIDGPSQGPLHLTRQKSSFL